MSQHVTPRAFHLYAGLQSTWILQTSPELTALSSSLLTEAGCANLFTLPPCNMRPSAKSDTGAGDNCRDRICRLLGGLSGRLVGMQQVHGAQIGCVDTNASSQCLDNVDGMIVDCPGVIGLALSADCPLIAVTAPGLGAFGLAHAGWRGTVSGMAGRLIARMVEHTGCHARDLTAAIAPSAGPCCYEVGPDVVEKASQTLADHERFFVRTGQAVCFDLRSANIAQLLAAGLMPERIDLAQPCTICDDRFYSYRRDGSDTGHAGFAVSLRSD